MKRIFALCAALALLLWPLVLPAAAQRDDFVLHDDASASLMSESEWSSLADTARQLSARYNCGVYMIVMDDYTDFGDRLDAVVENIFDEFDLGFGEDRAAIILTLSMDDRSYDLDTHGYVTDYILAGQRRSLERSFLDDFKENDWYSGFSDYLRECENVLADINERIQNGEEPNYQQSESRGTSTETAVGIGAAAGGVVSLISCSAMKAGMRSVSKAGSAEHYTSREGIELTVAQDIFTHTTQTRTRIESSGGRSSGGGGGGHSHSGGHF